MEKTRRKDLSFAEAGDYFDSHDILGAEESVEIKQLSIRIPKKRYVGVNLRLFKKIEREARKAHMSEDRLIEEWLTEKVG